MKNHKSKAQCKRVQKLSLASAGINALTLSDGLSVIHNQTLVFSAVLYLCIFFQDSGGFKGTLMSFQITYRFANKHINPDQQMFQEQESSIKEVSSSPATVLANDTTCSPVCCNREAIQNTCLQFPLFWNDDRACS